MLWIDKTDNAIFEIIAKEENRQEEHIELIASENYVSPQVLRAQGSVLTNKYAEGYPGKRYYGGCAYVDEAETLAISRVCELFGCNYANVQPHSGSCANEAAMSALLSPGDTILGMKLSDGGHLTHGSSVSFSGKLYNAISYGVDESGWIDYDALEALAKAHQPKLIIAGFSAYSRILDWARFRKIADQVGAILMADIAHVAGLIIADCYPNPFPYADVVTSTTHKTIRGPRGGIILSNQEDYAKKIRSAVFPGLQGGPLMHAIAAKAVAFYEAGTEDFKRYQAQVVKNAQIMAKTLMAQDIQIVSGGTDNHMMLIDLRKQQMTGKTLEAALSLTNITVNKNTVPQDPESPFVTSGIRIGTPAMTTRGFLEAEAIEVANWMVAIIKSPTDQVLLEKIKGEVHDLCRRFPVYG